MKKMFIILSIFILNCIYFPQINQADEANSFFVTPVIPAEQEDSELGYFDLLVKPSEQRTVQIAITNSSDKSQKFNINLNSATTNMNGVIDYEQVRKDHDYNLPINFSEISSYPDEVEVAPKEQKLVDITLKLPEKSFSGMILGGISVTPVDNAKDENTNKLAYLIAICLTEKKEPIQPKIILEEVFLDQTNYRNIIKSKLINSAPMIISDVEIRAQITKKNNKKVLYESTVSNQKMAPNSAFDFPIELNDQFRPGDYTVTLDIKTEKDRFELSKDFKIETEKAAKLNKESVDEPKNVPIHLYVMIILGVLVLALLLTLIFVMRKKKKEKEPESK